VDKIKERGQGDATGVGEHTNSRHGWLHTFVSSASSTDDGGHGRVPRTLSFGEMGGPCEGTCSILVVRWRAT
jgi:hypothetical protein